MNCVCYNIINRLQESLGTLISTLVNNRVNTGLPSSDDGTYQPNFNLLNQNNPTSFDSNTFFYICMILLLLITLATMLTSRRRRLGRNGSSIQ